MMEILSGLMIVGVIIALTRLWSTASQESGGGADSGTFSTDSN